MVSKSSSLLNLAGMDVVGDSVVVAASSVSLPSIDLEIKLNILKPLYQPMTNG